MMSEIRKETVNKYCCGIKLTNNNNCIENYCELSLNSCSHIWNLCGYFQIST
jgi:hypothetical protein